MAFPTKNTAPVRELTLDRWLSVTVTAFVLLATIAVAQFDPWPIFPIIVAVAAFVFLFTGEFSPGRSKSVAKRFVLSKFWTSLLMGLAFMAIAPAFLNLERYAMLRSAGHCFALIQTVLFFQHRDARIVRRQFEIATIQLMLATMLAESSFFAFMLVALTPMLLILLAVVALQQQRENLVQRIGFQRSLSPLTAPLSSAQSNAGNRIGTSDSSRTAGGEIRGDWTTTLPTLPRRRPWTLRLVGLLFPVLALAMVFFLLFPRFGEDRWQGMRRNGNDGFAGFSDQIRLGELTPMLDNSEEVVRVQLLDPREKNEEGQNAILRRTSDDGLYLRGSTVNFYENGRWAMAPVADARSATIDSMSELDDLARENRDRDAVEGAFYLPWKDRYTPLIRAIPLVEQRLTLLSQRYSEIFCVWPPLYSRVSDTNRLFYSRDDEKLYQGDQRLFALEDAEQVALLQGNQRDLSFATLGISGTSQLRVTPNIESGYRPDTVTPLLTRIVQPERLAGLKAISDSWYQELNEETRRDPQLVAGIFETKLKNEGSFTYQVGGVERDLQLDPIEDFVTNHRQGHCEYFATALALMLRFQGIPTRVVLGFCTPEYMETSGTYRARQHHAHAWVEVYLTPGQIPSTQKQFDEVAWRFGGWLRLDPTPSITQTTLWNSPVAQAFDSFDYFWREYIVGMNESRQQVLYAPVGRRLGQWTERLFQMTRGGPLSHLIRLLFRGGPAVHAALLIAALLAPYGLFLVLRWFVRQGRRILQGILSGVLRACVRSRNRARTTESVGVVSQYRRQVLQLADQLFRRWETLMERHELRRGISETQREFVHRCDAVLRQRYGTQWETSEVYHFVESFYALRFGWCVPDDDEQRRTARFLERVAAIVASCDT